MAALCVPGLASLLPGLILYTIYIVPCPTIDRRIEMERTGGALSLLLLLLLRLDITFEPIGVVSPREVYKDGRIFLLEATSEHDH